MIRPFFLLTAVGLLPVVLPGHGGRYRGVPVPVRNPAPSEAPPAIPDPPPRPVPPPPIFPPPIQTPGPRGVTTPRGVPLGEDLTRWQLWWEMNKDRYLNLRQAVLSGSPVTGDDDFYLGARRRAGRPEVLTASASLVESRILPVLRRALLDTSNPDLVTACLLGLAKVGHETRAQPLLPLLAKHLRSGNAEVRETAALSLGVSGLPRGLPTLRDLLHDTAVGRRLVGRREVGSRVRAFAAFGLGILGAEGDAGLREQAFVALTRVLQQFRRGDRDILVAVITAIGALGGSESADRRLAWRAVAELTRFFRADLGRGAEVVQAHIPVAIARLLGRGDSVEHERCRKLFLTTLRGRNRGREVRQSTAIALGLLAGPGHEEVSAALYQIFQKGRDAQTRSFSLIALGDIGGTANRTRLLRVLATGRKVLDRPWAALALGVMSYRQRIADGRVDETVGRALTRQLAAARNRDAAGAFAIGLGLSGWRGGVASLRDRLAQERGHGELLGFLSIGLALMRDSEAVGPITALLRRSVRRPAVLRRAAIALGCLRDRFAARALLDMMESSTTSVARLASIAGALQLIGDRRTVSTLVQRVGDPDLPALARAFCAAALGGIADPRLLPFQTRFAQDSNYRAAVPVLTDQSTGILDLL